MCELGTVGMMPANHVPSQDWSRVELIVIIIIIVVIIIIIIIIIVTATTTTTTTIVMFYDIRSYEFVQDLK